MTWEAIGQQFSPDVARQRHKTARGTQDRQWHARRRSAAV